MPSAHSGSILQFGDFRLDCARFELSCKGRPVHVERKPMELLILLASREGQLVPRAEIAERLWSSEVFVDTEHGINTAIRKLRYLLHDDPHDPHFVQTVTGMGYRFVALVLVSSTVVPHLPTEVMSEPALATPPYSKRSALRWYVGVGSCVVLALGWIAIYPAWHRQPEVRYTRLTDFTDSAVAPALSPDGRMLAFIRSGKTFLTSDQIYVKMLPDGEAKRVTDDARPKYGLAFSPDGSEIAYTVLESSGFSTYKVSTLGGEPNLLLKNAAGLVWLGPQRLLFSEVRTGDGIHLGVVTATVTRTDLREIYFPMHERGMAHFSFPSPDRHWALVVEMNGNGDWAPCRLVDLQDQSPPRSVGPTGACTSAAWSPDSGWMYFAATVKGQSHVWRQRFPDRTPEQMTFGPTEESGVVMEPDGQALITSVGVHESAVWIHDERGERPLSSEGEVASDLSPPAFNPDASALYYLLRRGEGPGAELWRTAVASGKSEAVFPGISMTAFDLSPDGKQVVYSTAASDGTTQLWLAPEDQSLSATKLEISGARTPRFSGGGQILFLATEGNTNYLEQINLDGSHRSRVLPYAILEFQGVSPDRRRITAVIPKMPEKNLPAVVVIPLNGGTPQRVCESYCSTSWSMDGRFLFVSLGGASRTGPGRSMAIPVGSGDSLRNLPAGGDTPVGLRVVPGADLVARGELVPGKDPEHYAWVNTTVHRNLYRISLP